MQEESELEYAGFWLRFGATLIDSVLLFIVTAPLLMAVYGTSYWTASTFAMGPADLLISYGLPAVLIIVLWIRFAKTPGKMAIGATIVDARTGGKPGTGQFLIRYVGYFVSALPLCLGYFWAGFDPRKQAWHDKLARTVVVRRKTGAAEAVRFEPPPGPPPA